MPRLGLRGLPEKVRGVPTRSLQLIALLVLVNLVVWAAMGVVLHFHPGLIGSAVLAYTLGLRHALDADHISAIDLMTRRLIAAGQKPVAVGTFFSLGHSTVVLVTCIVVAATSGALRDRFDDFARVGNIVGTSVSAAFLLVLCVGNAWVLYKLVQRLRDELRRLRERRAAVAHDENGPDDAAAGMLRVEGVGFLARVFRWAFRIVDRPWKMFPLGILFGLGFDTSSEIAILGIASVQAANGTSIWLILIFPILFTGKYSRPHRRGSSQITKKGAAGMCLLDTTDGAVMMALYTSKAFARDVVAILYYSIVLTGITIFVSAFIGLIQVLSLVEHVAEPEGPFWDGVGAIGDHYDIIGGSICGLFLLVGIASFLVYRPWRRRIERRHARLAEDVPADSGMNSGSAPDSPAPDRRALASHEAC